MAIAFSLVPLLRQWCGTIREISLDSAWNTNKARFEIYALLGEIYGSGCPLGYLLIQSAPNHDTREDGKQKYLQSLLKYFRKNWLSCVIGTLTDKDRIEINAFAEAFPDAKHQLCFWHCLCAIKTRLSILCRRPAPYNEKDAHDKYKFIDPQFVPISQMPKGTAMVSTSISERIEISLTSSHQDKLYVATTAISHLTIRLGGMTQNQASPPPTKIMIRINGEAIPEYQAKLNRNSSTDPPGSTSDLPDAVSEIEPPDDEYDLTDSVDQMDIETDSEDGPDWMFEAGEILVRDPHYTFCLAPHRKQLLHIFTKHFCSHPFFSLRIDGRTRSAADIERDSVYEMYEFCHTRGLREVWAYMWNLWYCPRMWKLWAWSSYPGDSPFLTRLRTTMSVENFWKQLKHKQLHHLLHPRLDQLVFILIYKVTPMYIQRMDFLAPEACLGCEKSLSPFQASFKKNWAELREKSVRDGASELYHTEITDWSCRCGQQMYNRHHLCKHLVHAVESSVGRPPPKFWIQISRRRVKPLYKHEALQGLETHLVDASEDSGSITDGDDNIFQGKWNVLRGGGGWKGLTKSSLLGKHSRILSDPPTPATDTPSSNTAPLPQTSITHRWLNEPSIEINHLHEQSVELNTDNQEGTYTANNTEDFNTVDPLLVDWDPNELGADMDGFSTQPSSSRATTPSNYEEDDINNEIDEVVDKMLMRAGELEEAARIIWEQAPYRNTIWFNSLARCDIGKDVSKFVSDIHKHIGAHVRDNTWGNGSNRQGRGKGEERQWVVNTGFK
ncbi:hypothetical protein PQX77_016154 [Marasmius sp. AFHP31]|nr:hypothetical protein PQX77_016154 [Marasmius sp. AFHP31]